MQGWTVEQHVALDRLAGLMPAKALVDELAPFGERHSERAIVQQAATSKLSLALRRRRHDWTDEEDAVIREHAGRLTSAEIVAELRRLPGCVRTVDAVKKRAGLLGVSLLTGPAALSLKAVRAIFGAPETIVLGWVEAEYLRVDRRGGRSATWRFLAPDVEAFIVGHPEQYDWQAIWQDRWRDLAQFAARRNPWLTIDQTAEALGVTPQYARVLARSGALVGAVRVRQSWRIPASALAALREQRAVA